MITREGALAILTLPDFEPLTRHDTAFALKLRDAVRDTADEDNVKVIVLRASGTDFAPPSARRRLAGGGPQWHAAFAAASGLYQNLAFCKKVVMTAVNGRCCGAGSMLVLCSDYTVCDSQSTFESPFASIPEANLVLAALTVRLNRAKSWLLGGEPWSAEHARHAGLVNRVVPAKEVRAQALAMAQAAARMPLDGIAMSKILVEALLDTQGVGQDFDMAGLYADAMGAAA